MPAKMGQPAEAAGSEITPTGEQLRALRQTMRWSQSMLARILGVQKFTVQRWEADRVKMSPVVRRAYRKLLRDPAVLAEITRAAEQERLVRAQSA